MKPTMRAHRTEALVGLAVVMIALAFVLYAWQQTGGSGGGMRVTALFPSANGISVGTDVRVAGLRVGQVTGHKLDQQSFQAEVTLALDETLRIPADSSAAITAESLLGGSYVALVPGGASEPMKHGDVIVETQGSVDMMSLIGGVINRSGGGEGAAAPTSTMDEAPARPADALSETPAR